MLPPVSVPVVVKVKPVYCVEVATTPEKKLPVPLAEPLAIIAVRLTRFGFII